MKQLDKTWYINQETKRIQGMTEGIDAVQQAITILLHVERFRWQIYHPDSGMQWSDLLGQDSGYVAVELQRRIKEALSMDDRIRDISGFSCQLQGDALTVVFTVQTIYGELSMEMEVEHT